MYINYFIAKKRKKIVKVLCVQAKNCSAMREDASKTPKKHFKRCADEKQSHSYCLAKLFGVRFG